MNRTSALVMILSLITSALGFIRNSVVVFYFGSSTFTDSYFLSLMIPMTLFSIIGAGINSGFIPIYTDINGENSNTERNNFTSGLLFFCSFIVILIFIPLYFYSEYIVGLFFNNLTKEQFLSAEYLYKANLVVLIFLPLQFVVKSFLEVKRSFIIIAVSNLILNVVNLLFIIFGGEWDIRFLYFGNLIAVVLSIVIMILFSSSFGFKLRFRVDYDDLNLKKMLRLIVPIMVGASLNPINVFIDRYIASNVWEGGITILTLANKVTGLFYAIFILTVVNLVYPEIAKCVTNKNTTKLKNTIEGSFRDIFALTFPIVLVIVLYSEVIVTILYGRGEFDSESIRIAAVCLIFYAISLSSAGIREVLNRVFYANGNTKTPLFNSLLGVSLNIVLNVALSKQYGLIGIPLATSISSILVTIVLFKKHQSSMELRYNSMVIDIVKILFLTTSLSIFGWLIFCFLSDHFKEEILFIGVMIVTMPVYLYFLIKFNIYKLEKVKWLKLR